MKTADFFRRDVMYPHGLSNRFLYFGIVLASLQAPYAWSAEKLTAWRTGEEFQAQLEKTTSVQWSSQPLKPALIRFASTYQVAIWLDRRIDPTQEPQLAMALGFLGNYDSNHVLGRRMQDGDRGVRLLAENGIRELWCRDGNGAQQQQLQTIIRLNRSWQFDRAVRAASELIDDAPCFAEAWNQRAIAYYHLGRYQLSADDCQQTLELNPYHYAAAVGMAHCYLELDDARSALECFRRALKLNPDLEEVRTRITFLRQAFEEL